MSKKITIEKLQLKSSKVLSEIAERRQELGISQADLAYQLNMTPSGYFKIEKGESKLDLIRLFEIAHYLNIDAKKLF
ncbi:helix-turn-helix domain-containing protein [Polaribacter septentrionalilitoris]|uniref:helix-turn-helix domain-containing protein n=1 Tax=Polaribacter septentrionalilitoris TaxID=2494657 RepID=UPI001357779F|nr:helix-turn-helix transcriptional regulator [Polaribacter septentrionalilitoris]